MTKSKKYLIFAVEIIIAGILALIDQLIKRAAVENLMGKQPVVLIKNFLGLCYAENTGAAFSFMSNSTMVLSVITLILIIGIVVALFLGKIKGKLLNVCAVMIIGGGVGNLIDRFANGYVVDYIETLFINFPIFNFADMLVVVGVIIVIIYLIYDMIKDEKQKKAEGKTDVSA